MSLNCQCKTRFKVIGGCGQFEELKRLLVLLLKETVSGHANALKCRMGSREIELPPEVLVEVALGIARNELNFESEGEVAK